MGCTEPAVTAAPETGAGPRTPGGSGGSGLYVHVPFCRRRCAYCDFYARPLGAPPGAVGAEAVRRYLAALDLELARLAPPGFAPATVYIGGGTPTALPARALDRLLALVRTRIEPARVAEWTCEINPGTLDAAGAARLRAAGVNRAALGVQSFDPDRLRRLGRIHGPAEIPRAFADLRAAGFENVAADLIYGVPGQTVADLAADLEALLALRPDHVSIYALELADGTPLAEACRAGTLAPPDDDATADQYAHARAALLRAGYRHDELSSFSLPGQACRHNRRYWDGGDYLGIGPAAHSRLGSVRRGNPPDLAAWAAALECGDPPWAFEERLDPEAAAREALVLALRRIEGVDAAAFRRRTGFAPEALRPAETARLFADGRLVRTPRGFRLADEALFVSDAVFRELI